jgi:hypothetical protein
MIFVQSTLVGNRNDHERLDIVLAFFARTNEAKHEEN